VDDVDVWRYAIVSCMPETTMTTSSHDLLKQAVLEIIITKRNVLHKQF